MKVILLILVFMGIVLIQAPGLVRKKQWRELILSSVLLAFGFLLSLLRVVGVLNP